VIYPKYTSRAVSVLALLPMMLAAQRAQDTVVPLKNWASPLYWQPNHAESKARGTLLPQGPDPVAEPTFLTFVAITPCRLVDTRGASARFEGGITPFNGPSLGPNSTTVFPVQSSAEATGPDANTEPAPCGVIPSIAEAYSLNLTVIPHLGAVDNYVTLWATDTEQPVVSTVNDTQGLVVANAAIVAASEKGSINLYTSGPAIVDVIIDLNGYFASPTDLNNNTAIGAGALAVNGGSNNTATGAAALSQNTVGSYNTATGFDALTSNQGGSFNTATGDKALLSNTSGSNNTATGYGALVSNACGVSNTASGLYVMEFNTSGSFNTAEGQNALYTNTAGSDNTAIGFEALELNTVSGNTATGYQALQNNSSGAGNTANGYLALNLTTTTSGNTAIGYQALQLNTGGSNTASGYAALQANTNGFGNTAVGSSALTANSGNSGNTAVGYTAMQSSTGPYNTALGAGALSANTTGSSNIAVGNGAGSSGPLASNNTIYIGNVGASGDGSGTIRIGDDTATSFFVAGVYGTPVAGGTELYVNSNGQIGSLVSSSRFKEQIIDMGENSSKLLQLRPVNYFYKPEYDDGSHLLQYGLIAEDVAKVYPEMVAYGKDGQVLTVKYQMLAPMLLNELEKQADQIRQQFEQNRELEDRLTALETLLPTVPQPLR